MVHAGRLSSLAFVAVAWLLVRPVAGQPVPQSMVDLVRQSDYVADVRVTAADGDKVRMKVRELLKGRPRMEEMTLNLAAVEDESRRHPIEHWIAHHPSTPGVLFSGQYTFHVGVEVATGKETFEIFKGAFLHIGPYWLSVEWNDDAGKWDFISIQPVGGGTWQNETALLPDCVKYILAAGDKAEWPLYTSIETDRVVRIGSAAGKVHGLAAVDLTGQGLLTLLVLSDGGDRAYRADAAGAGRFGDATDSLKLGSRSRFIALADFNADGRLDVASVHGRKLTVWLQSDRGTFEDTYATAELPREAIGLSVLDVGIKGRAGLVISTDHVPLLATWTLAGRLSIDPIIHLPAGTTQPEDLVDEIRSGPLGLARPCAVADFDGDGIPDVLQPFENGGLFYKGGRGGFQAPQWCASAEPFPRWISFRDKANPNLWHSFAQRPNTIYSGSGPADIRLADLDGDGRLDVLFLPRESTAFQWRNCGSGRFDGPMPLGQVDYIGSTGAYASIGDLNNDGREDLLLTSDTYEPTVFFGQGFGMFQWGGAPLRQEMIDDPKGHQAGLIVDVNGDGRQDFVLVKSGGDLLLAPQKPGKANGLGVRAALPSRAGFAGPLVVTGWDGDRRLGARILTPGGEAFFGCRTAGEIALRWQYPGEPVREWKATVKDRVVRTVLGAEQAIELTD